LILSVSTQTISLSPKSGEDSAYNAINSIKSATGNLYTMQRYLDSSSVSESQKIEAIKSLTPQADNSGNRTVFNSNNASVNAASSRLGSLRSGVSSGDMGEDRSVWVQQFGASVNQGNMSDSEGYKSHSMGVAIGTDHEVSDDFLTFGISGSYASSKVKSRNGTKETGIDTYQGNIYSGYNLGKYFLNTVAGMAWNNYSSSRVISVTDSVATAKYSGQSYIGRVEAGFDHKLKNGFTITPALMITAAHNRVADYSEEGAGTLNLDVSNNTGNFFETRFGTEVSHDFLTSKGTRVYHEVNASYGYDFAATKQVTNSNFSGQTTSFESSGSKVVQGSWRVGTGLKVYCINAVTISANYDFDYKQSYHGHTGSLKFKYSF
jgi:outer membrane autotransporter protein